MSKGPKASKKQERVVRAEVVKENTMPKRKKKASKTPPVRELNIYEGPL